MMKQWKIGGITMTSPLMVGGGVCKSPESVIPYLHPDLPIGAVETGSYTLEKRDGNSGTLEHWSQELNSGFNSFGMPNMGFEAAYKELQGIVADRPIVMNVAGFSPDEVLKMVSYHAKNYESSRSISAINLNCGCPNAHDKKTVPMANDFDSIFDILEGLRKLEVGGMFPLWIKLSPYLTSEDLNVIPSSIDISSIPVVADDLAKSVSFLMSDKRYHGIISAVVVSNTLGNCIYRVDGKSVTTPNDGKAGLSGSVLKKFSLRQVKYFREHLPASIDVIASGGVLKGDDVVDYLEVGASGVQCVSLPYWFGGPKAIAKLPEESCRLLARMI